MQKYSPEHAPESAMTEIALALAMGFFSLMVLTLISMGVGTAPATNSPAIVLAPVAGPTGGSGATEISPDDLTIIFDGQHFFDTNMTEIDPQTAIKSRPNPAARVVLALDPALPLQRAIAARGALAAENLVITGLDARWLKALSDRRSAK